MSERDRYPAGVPCWVDTAQPDVDAALGFYAELFGWQYDGPGRMPGDPPGRYYVARRRDRDVAGVSSLATAGASPAAGVSSLAAAATSRAAGVSPLPRGDASAGAAWLTYVSVSSADDTAAVAAAAGGSVLTEPFDAPPAGRMAILADPHAAVFAVWEPAARQGAQLVNEPSAWSMSRLNTPDPEAAAAFYRRLFGWGEQSFSMGDAQVVLWRLRGYVGGEAQQPVPRDVVAAMAASDDATPAHWSVDFWTDDADRAAQTTASRGGSVLAGPFDLPGFRTAVLQDPQGAIFSVSQLVLG